MVALVLPSAERLFMISSTVIGATPQTNVESTVLSGVIGTGVYTKPVRNQVTIQTGK